MLPIVAIVGRPNVGKSALFNRLIKKRHAIVSDVYGTTRDSLSTSIVIKKKEIEVIDTAGIISFMDENNEGDLFENVQEQAKIARDEADLILFLVDATVPLTKDDLSLAKNLRSSPQTVVLVVTKCDTDKIQYQSDEFYKLGFTDPVFISSLHNRGITQLEETIHASLKKAGLFKSIAPKTKKSTAPTISLCIVGKPNVGKSSLFNKLQQKSHAVVSEVAGTTRDTIDSEISYADLTFKIIDTAGLRRPGKVEEGIEKFSVLRTMRAIKRSDVALFVIDAQENVSKMDHAVARYVLEQNKGLIIIVNKWDVMEKEKNIMDRFLTYMQDRFDYLPWAPVLFVSAKSGKNIGNILDQVLEVYNERKKRIETGPFNRFIDEIVSKYPPRGTKKISPKIFYATQVETAPPHFLLFVNEKEAFHFSWMRYFENRLREKFGFSGTPVVLELRNREREDRSRKRK